jgi:hypothetical protein
MTTAGGLVFFAGFQDYYIRAYDAKNGRLAWHYALPVRSSATPISYVSPATGKQYIAISVGGAAHSPDNGDYVMAFAPAARIWKMCTRPMLRSQRPASLQKLRARFSPRSANGCLRSLASRQSCSEAPISHWPSTNETQNFRSSTAPASIRMPSRNGPPPEMVVTSAVHCGFRFRIAAIHDTQFRGDPRGRHENPVPSRRWPGYPT